jgi:hypothetical protein
MSGHMGDAVRSGPRSRVGLRLVSDRAPGRAYGLDVASDAASPSDRVTFLGWLTACVLDEELDADGHLAPDPTFEHLLDGLGVSRSPLPTELAEALGLGPGATVGDAATELLAAVTDLTGPRCRSYRSAVYFLQGHPGPLFMA